MFSFSKMAHLDEKFLDGPSVGYCSSSEDEGNEQKEDNSLGDGRQQYSQPTTTQRTPKTGPKGVLADYKQNQRRKCTENREEEKRLMQLAKRFSFETRINDQQNYEDELEKIRRHRLEQMKSMAKGRILEVPDRFEFLQLIEQQAPNCLLFMHIYADGNEHSEQLNEALLELAGKFWNENDRKGNEMKANAKFYKIQTKILGTTTKFTKDALPALQIYRQEQLIGNFIRLANELGDDYNGNDLLMFLRRNGILDNSLPDDGYK